MEPAVVFIGHDPRERDAYDVCVASLLRHARVPLHAQALDQDALRRAGLYRRAPAPGEAWADWIDGREFSTAFTFTRFLVPALMQWRGWALFCDCDFLWRADVGSLWRLRDDRYAVMVVKHDYQPPEAEKMDGRAQYGYARKAWSSLMLVNAGHEANRRLTVDDVNLKPKLWLHGFEWLKDEEIGALPAEWNWLSGWSTEAMPKAVHFTRGVPSMPGYEAELFADEWFSYLPVG